jgi:hypothetical protein
MSDVVLYLLILFTLFVAFGAVLGVLAAVRQIELERRRLDTCVQFMAQINDNQKAMLKLIDAIRKNQSNSQVQVH